MNENYPRPWPGIGFESKQGWHMLSLPRVASDRQAKV